MTNEEIREVAEFIEGIRENEPKSWWVGIYDAHTESPKLVSTSLRGFFQDSCWKPVQDEHAGDCCEKILSDINAEKKPDNPFVWMEHCTNRDHIAALLKKRTSEQLSDEYQYMLEQVMTSLTESF